MTVAIAIAGAAGRMGRALVAAAAADAGFRIVGATERPGSAAHGGALGALGVMVTDSAQTAAVNADIWIDFTAPAATLAALEALRTTPVRAAIVGTTGFSADEAAQLARAAARIAIVASGNFSLGVNLLASLVRQAASRLGPDWDIEIVEAHHRRKQDAPSGTALLLGQAAAAGRGRTLSQARLAPHAGGGEARAEGGIGFASIRGGGIVGDHDVSFAAETEIVTLSHRALDRAAFADGALAAARWAADKQPGLYSMQDVLALP